MPRRGATRSASDGAAHAPHIWLAALTCIVHAISNIHHRALHVACMCIASGIMSCFRETNRPLQSTYRKAWCVTQRLEQLRGFPHRILVEVSRRICCARLRGVHAPCRLKKTLVAVECSH